MRAHLIAAAVLVLVTACASTPAASLGEGEGSTGDCEPVEYPQLQGGEHLIGAQPPPVPYSSTPPTSGWHYGGAVSIAVQPPSEPLSEPNQVSVLGTGAVVISYHELSDADRTALADLVQESYEGRVAVTSYDELEPGQVVLTAWGAVQRCSGLDMDAVTAFVDTYADENPSPDQH